MYCWHFGATIWLLLVAAAGAADECDVLCKVSSECSSAFCPCVNRTTCEAECVDVEAPEIDGCPVETASDLTDCDAVQFKNDLRPLETVRLARDLAIDGNSYVWSREGQLVVIEATLTVIDLEFRWGQVLVDVGATLRATRVTFTDCSASRGGAIAFYGGGSVLLFSSLIRNAHALDDGGAVHFREPPMDNVSPSLFFASRTTFTNCTSHRGSGGALAVFGDNVAVVLEETGFDNCSAPMGRGGAIAASRTSDDFAILSSTFSRCTSSVAGGAVFLNLPTSRVLINATSFEDCAVFDDSDDVWEFLTVGTSRRRDGTRAVNGGGGVWAVTEADLILNDVAFRNCSTASDGGGLNFASESPTATLRLDRTSFSECTAGGSGGGLSVGRIPLGGLDRVPPPTRVLADDVRISKCVAVDSGGGLHAVSSRFISVGPIDIMENSVTDGNGGGASFASSSAVSFASGIWTTNFAAGDGGGAAVLGGSRMEIAGTFVENIAGKNAGAVYVGQSGTRLVTKTRGAEIEVVANFVRSSVDTASIVLTSTTTEIIFERLSPVPGREVRRYVHLPPGTYEAWVFDGGTGLGWELGDASIFAPPTVVFHDEIFGGFSLGPGEDARRIASFTVLDDEAVDDNEYYALRFEKNIALTGDGGAMQVSGGFDDVPDQATTSNRLVDVVFGGHAVLRRTLFLNNSAVEGSGGALDVGPWAASQLFDVVAMENRADDHGGFVFVRGQATVDGLECHGNRAHIGGAVFVESDFRIVIRRFLAVENVASKGGGLGFRFPKLSPVHLVAKARLWNNSVTFAGAGAAIDNGHVTFENIEVLRNSAGGFGGGLYVEDEATTSIRDAPPCQRVRIVVDWRFTMSCERPDDDVLRTCDQFQNCADLDKTCDGCVCPFDGASGRRYYDIPGHLEGARPVAGSIDIQEVCLPYSSSSDDDDDELESYTIRLTDVLGKRWFGGSLGVFAVNDCDGGTEVHVASSTSECWVNSTTCELNLTLPERQDAPRSRFVGNHAEAGGGWYGRDGAVDAKDVEFANAASGYGANRATQPMEMRFLQQTPVSIGLYDAYGQRTATEYTSLRAGVRVVSVVPPNNGIAVAGASTICLVGICTFRNLAIHNHGTAASTVTLRFVTLTQENSILLDSDPLYVKQDDDPSEDKNRLPRWVAICALATVVGILTLALVCTAWTLTYRKRFIVTSALPRYLLGVCLGAGITILSNLGDVVLKKGRHSNTSCQLTTLVFPGLAFQAACLFAMMRISERVVEAALHCHRIAYTLRDDLIVMVPPLLQLCIVGVWISDAPLEAQYTCHRYADRGAAGYHIDDIESDETSWAKDPEIWGHGQPTGLEAPGKNSPAVKYSADIKILTFYPSLDFISLTVCVVRSRSCDHSKARHT